MKKRRLTLTLEVETDAPLRDLRKTKTVLLSSEKFIEGGGVIVDVIQIQVNVIQEKP
jgi:hypothetical protein